MVGQALGTIGSIISVFGKKQARDEYPMYKPLDLQEQATQANAINAKQLPESEKLAAQANTFNQDQLLKMLNAAIPGYDKLQKQQGDVIGSMLRGELPQGVKDQLAREAAAYGVTSGTTGSQFSGYRGLRQLGLNSLQYAMGGLSAADRWTQRSAQIGRAPMMDVTSMFVTPMQTAQFNAQQAALVHESKLGKWGLGNFLLDAGNSLMETGGMWGGNIGNFGGGGSSSSNSQWLQTTGPDGTASSYAFSGGKPAWSTGY